MAQMQEEIKRNTCKYMIILLPSCIFTIPQIDCLPYEYPISNHIHSPWIYPTQPFTQWLWTR